MTEHPRLTSPAPSPREVEHRKLARRAATEGFVLLRNDGTLPLRNRVIALFGAGAVITVKGGTGSGEVNERHSVSIREGLDEAGFRIVSDRWLDRFRRHHEESYRLWHEDRDNAVKGIVNPAEIIGIVNRVPFAYPTDLPIEAEDLAYVTTDTAVYVLSRQAGEGNDRHDTEGDWRLTAIERENIRSLVARYPKFVVILNSGGPVDLSWTNEISSIGALVYIAQGGMEGGTAIADVLSGDTNFSGKLTDTWAMHYADYPNASTFSHNKGDVTHDDYHEGIYVGYRYFDTFAVKPRYAFGFGLSYTMFHIHPIRATMRGKIVEIMVDVDNFGSVTGREVVQVYVTSPFASGKEMQRLVAFRKTQSIRAGGHRQVHLAFSLEACASYDAESASYGLASGEYVIRVGNASDHTAPIACVTLPRSVRIEQCRTICPLLNPLSEFSPPIRRPEAIGAVIRLVADASAFKIATHRYDEPQSYATGEIRNIVQRLDADELAKLCMGAGIHGKRRFDVPGACGSTTSELWERHGIPNIVMSDGPAGLNVISRCVVAADGTLRGAAAIKRFRFGMLGEMMMKMLSVPADGEFRYHWATAWPCGTLLAQTWNPRLVERIGFAVGREMREFGVTLWLAPGMNIHRNPLCGRNFEYYSEDPLLTGSIAAAITRGVQSVSGVGTTIKHFACNNQEDNRMSSSSNLSERTLREIYLKGFELVVKAAKPAALMSSYNLVNGVYAPNSRDLLTTVLRNEWGFRGLVMSDWNACDSGHGDPLLCAMAGNDIIMPGNAGQTKAIAQAINDGRIPIEAAQRSAGRVIEAIVNNAVYPFFPTR